ncbi:MAG: long-chain fatty acid--CoA ligase [Candidatus Marinimicrobia bacterium]|nr:long-chain fatty acid--CoA ligase [Candidatus Neomarinimicrobiota bacterium]MBL7110088.1 long-chain fatty acid--CoA ligase [Candidatus Neomarinimicrobiota bacterium]
MSYTTIADMFIQSIEKYADNPAFFDKIDGEWKGKTYKEAGEIVENLASGLASLSVQKGDKIAILSTNTSKWAYADYAITGLGAVTVTVYPTLTNPQINYIFDDSETHYAFVENKDQLSKTRSLLQKCEHMKAYILMDDSDTDEDDVIKFSQLLEKGKAFKDETNFNLKAIANTIKPDDLLTLIYTSGTTGNPKGAMLSHKNLVSNILSGRKSIHIDENDVFLSFLPLSHVFERMVGHFTGFSSGGRVYYAESIDSVAENMGEVKPTVMASVPRLYEKMYAKVLDKVSNDPPIRQKIFWWAIGVGKESMPYICKNSRPGGWLGFKFGLAEKLVFSKIKERVGGRLRFFVSGGAPLSQEIAEFFAAANIIILEGYGLTETSPVITNNRLEHVKFGTVGQPIDGVEVKIADDGEIICRGDNVMLGYYNNEAETRETIDDEGWFHTGDIGEFDEDGFLRITDRKKNIIVTSGGKNIAPAPMENALVGSKYVEQVVVVGDRRNFISALIVAAPEALNDWANKKGISDQIISNEQTIELFDDIVNKAMDGFAHYETIKKFKLVADVWSVETGELTPTLKVKRKVVEEKYADLIDSIYQV